ncbi:MAG: sigma-70 family RNA polymerase sigma factor [Xanthobacteraceae bacterium]
MAGPDEAAATFEPHRRRLTGLAYRMLGSLSEAEDIVQDAYLRWHAAERGRVDNPRAYLSRTVARLCLDHLKSARARRETYVGPWLPEPIVDETALAPDTASELADDLSLALMAALERLSPLERAAFLLHDVFEMEFDEIAKVLDRSESACRQLAARGRAHVQDARPRFRLPEEEVTRLSDAFHRALVTGDAKQFAAVLAADAVLYSDGGGKRTAAPVPIHGRDQIVRFFDGLARSGNLPPAGAVHRVRLGGLPGIVVADRNGMIDTIMTADVRDGQVVAIYAVRNPDKLAHLSLRSLRGAASMQ